MRPFLSPSGNEAGVFIYPYGESVILLRPIKSGKPFKSSIFRDEITLAANSIKLEMLKDFKATTASWDHQPTFGYKVDSGASVGGVRIQVATDDPIYGYVDQGTKKHIIRPKHKKALAFFNGRYIAKTKPKFIGSYMGGPTGTIIVRPEVHHPGTKARKFTETIRKRWEPEFKKEIQNALDRAARRFK